MNKVKFIALFAISLGFLSPLGASSLEKKIEDTIFQKTNTQAKVINIKPVDIKSLSVAVVEINNNQLPLFVSSDGKTIFGTPEIFITTNEKILETTKDAIVQTQAYNSRGKQERLLDNFKDKPESIVHLSSTGPKTNKTTYIVTDPNCPYCKDEMGRIDSVLSNSNVSLILVGIIGHQNSEMKSADILETTQKILKSKEPQKQKEEEILKHIKEVYFNPSYQPKFTSTALAQENSNIVIQSGVNAVPYKFVINKK